MFHILIGKPAAHFNESVQIPAGCLQADKDLGAGALLFFLHNRYPFGNLDKLAVGKVIPGPAVGGHGIIAVFLCQAAGKSVSHRVISVYNKDLLGFCLKTADPVQQSCLVGMSGHALHHDDFGADQDRLAEQLDLIRAVEQLPAGRSFRLIADEYNGGFRPPQIELQVVADPARVAHAGGADDDLWLIILVDGLGFLCRDRQAEVPELDGVDALPDQAHGLFIKAVLFIFHKDLCRGNSQGTVHIDREVRIVRNHIVIFDLADIVEHDLGPADGEGGDDDIAAPGQGLADDIGQLLDRIDLLLLVVAVSVSGFHNNIFRLFRQCGIPEQGLIVVADITRENDLAGDAAFCQPELNTAGSQQMADIRKAEFNAFAKGKYLSVRISTELFHDRHDVFHGVDRFVLFLFRALFDLFAAPFCFLRLDMGRVTQHDLTQGTCGACADDPASETVMTDLGKHSAVVDMGMGQKNKIDGGCRDRQGLVFKNISALFHTDIDQNVFSAHLQVMAAACYFMIGSNKSEFHIALLL